MNSSYILRDPKTINAAALAPVRATSVVAEVVDERFALLRKLQRMTARGWSILLQALLTVIGSLIVALPAHATVVWEDYQGTSAVGTDIPGPSYSNNPGTAAQAIANLRTIAADPARAQRTGTSAAVDYTQASYTLCDSVNDPGGPGCSNDVQGRVVYALLRFPSAGNYTLSVAHDDGVDVDMSTQYTNTSYRTVNYDIPVGGLGSFTSNDTTYRTIGVFNSASANRCILVRIYWNNQGGANFLRLRWTTPGGTTETIPSTQLFNPGVASSSSTCTGAITTTNTSLVVNKVVGATGRANAADQFTVSILDGGTSSVVGTATTSGTGTGQQASTGARPIASSTVYRITDAMASGSSYPLGAYSSTIACTRDGTAFTPTAVSAGVWTVSATAANQRLACTVTNSRLSQQFRLGKSWVDGINGHTVTATTSGAINNATLSSTAGGATTATAVTVYVGETITLPNETYGNGATAALYHTVIECTGGSPLASGATNRTITIASNTTATVCTYRNTRIIPLNVVKSSEVKSDGMGGIAPNAKAIPGATIQYCIIVTNQGTLAATTLAASDPLPANVTYKPGSMRSGPTCAAATTVEDDDGNDAGETDGVTMSISGRTVSGAVANLSAGASFSMVFQVTVN